MEGEDEVKNQEDEIEDGRDCEACRVESRREIKTHNHSMRKKHGRRNAHYTLSQCHVRHCYECRETRQNVTCEGVLFTETDLFGCFLFLQTDLLLGSRSSG